MAIDYFTDFVFNFIMKQSASVDSSMSLIQYFKIDGFEDQNDNDNIGSKRLYKRKYSFEWILENDIEFKAILVHCLNCGLDIEL